MDGGTLEMDLGMEFYEQWNWQRFREAESMELDDEVVSERDRDVAQMGVDTGDVRKVRESIDEIGEVGSRSMVLPQYDGTADDVGEDKKAASISKIGVDGNATSRHIVLPQYDGPAEDAEEAVSISKTREEEVDVSSYQNDATISIPLLDESSDKNASKAQEQSAVLEVAEANKEETHPNNLLNQNCEALQVHLEDGEHPPEELASGRKSMLNQKKGLKAPPDNLEDLREGDNSPMHDGEAEQRGDRQMTIADDESISDFLAGETRDEMVKIRENMILRETHKETSVSKSIAIETASDLDHLADADDSGENNHVEDQINDKIEGSFIGNEDPVPEKSHDEISSLREASTEMEVEAVVDEVANEVINGPEESHGNISNVAMAHSNMIDEADINVKTNGHFEIYSHAVESDTNGFLNNQDLRDLEGKSNSISSHDQSPVKFTTQDGYFEGALTATKVTTDGSVSNAPDMDNVPALTYVQTQDSSITEQGPVNDNSVEDVDLPPLPRTKAPMQTKQLEIPDSDAITESSQQSTQKVSHTERTLDSAMKNAQNQDTSMANNATGEENEDRGTDGIASSFGRECATSSIDPKKHLKDPETMEAETVHNGRDDPEEVEESGFAEKLKKNSKADGDDNIQVESPSAQSLSQKKTNKRGRPPGRKGSGISNSKGSDVGSIEKKEKLVEADSDKPMRMNAEENSNASSPVPEKKKRGRPSSRKTSALSFDEPATEEDKAVVDATESSEVTFIDKAYHTTKQSSADETPTTELSPSSPAQEKRKRGRPSVRKIPTLSAVTADSGDIKNAERGVAPMNEENINLIVGPKLPDEPAASSPMHSMQEKKRRGRPPGRNSFDLSLEKQDAEEAGEDLDELNDVMAAILPSDDVHIVDDTMDELTTNSFSPVKRKRGRPANRKSSNLSPEKKYTEEADEDLNQPNEVTVTAPSDSFDDDLDDDLDAGLMINQASRVKRNKGISASRKSSGLSLRKGNAEESAKVASSYVPVVLLDDIEMDEATPNHKSTEEFATIASSSVKRKRGRPAGRKSSGIEPEQTEMRKLPHEFSSLPLNDIETQEATTNGKLDDLDDDSPVRPRKRGRPSSRKVSELTPQKTVVDEVSDEITEDMAPEEATNTDINESVAYMELADELLAINSPPKIKKGRKPASRKVSELDSQNTTVNVAAGENPDSVVAQEIVAAGTNGSSIVNSSPEKRKRGRPSNRKSSGVSAWIEDAAETVKTTSNHAASPVSKNIIIAEATERATDASLSANSSPAKRKRGRPARKASSLDTGSATKEIISSNAGSSGKIIPIEIADSDEGEDELQDESPPVKKIKPEPKKRGRRPSGIKILDTSTEDRKAEEELTNQENTRDEHDENLEVEIQARDKPASQEKKRRGRPSATKARRISNSDSEVTDEEQQMSEKVELPSATNEEPVEEEVDEQEEPIIEKKKRGRPALLKNKGKQSVKTPDFLDVEDVSMKNMTSTIGSSKGKVSGSQVSTSSNTSSSSQRQEAFFAEIKAMKISSIQARNAQLRTEIKAKREKVKEITKELEKPAHETVKRHIKLLHDYNDIKDVGQGLVGMIADNRGVRVGELYGEFGVEIGD
ncbi:hypothetical protein NHQ30_005402 [Ciborinia camelliae]|nr:hypothetical protein NHQ30_005402 [Ciborinia camelliae]